MKDKELMRNRGGELASQRRWSHPLDRLFDELGEPLLGGWLDRGSGDLWAPPVNIEETSDAYHVSAELPGVNKDDIEVNVENNVLTISGERKWEREQGGQVRRVESGYGSFSRSFTLPQKVDPDQVEAKFDNGMLRVRIPKDESARSRRITIS